MFTDSIRKTWWKYFLRWMILLGVDSITLASTNFHYQFQRASQVFLVQFLILHHRWECATWHTDHSRTQLMHWRNCTFLSYIHLIIVMWKFSYSVNFSTWGFSVLFLPLSTSYNGHSFPLRLSEGVSLSARMWINQNQCETIMS